MAVITGALFLYMTSVITVLATLLYLYLRHSHSYWKNKGVPYVESSLFFGHLKDPILRRKTMSETMRQIYNHLGNNRYGGMYMLHKPVLLLKDPELIKLIFVKSAANFHSHSGTFSEEDDPLHAKTLMNLKGERWRTLRAKLSPTFSSGKIKKMFHLVIECGSSMRDYLQETLSEQNNIVEMKDFSAKYTTDVIGSCAFGIQCNSFKDSNSEFKKMGQLLLAPPNFIKGIKMFCIMFFPSVARFFGFAFVHDDVAYFFRNVVRETMEYREKHGVVRNDFLDLLMELKKYGRVADDENEDKQSLEEIETHDLGKRFQFTIVSLWFD